PWLPGLLASAVVVAALAGVLTAAATATAAGLVKDVVVPAAEKPDIDRLLVRGHPREMFGGQVGANRREPLLVEVVEVQDLADGRALFPGLHHFEGTGKRDRFRFSRR